MVVHIGLDAWFGTLEIYDHEKKKSISFPSMFNEFENIDVIENVCQVFEKVKQNVKKGNKYGNVGIHLFTNLDTPNRRKLIEIAKSFGFCKVVFTNGFIGEYLNAMLQSNIAPKNDNIIWTFNSPDLFIWIKYCGKANYYKRFQNVKCSTSEDLIKIQERCELTQPPHLIVYSSNFPIEKNIIKKAFPNCQISKFSGTIKPAKAALTKARILANHLAVKEFDINPMLDDDVNVKVNNDIIITFKAGENLPSQKNVHIDLFKNETKLNVFINDELFQIIDVKFPMTTFADFLIYFFIDEDGMYKLNYLEMNPLYKIERHFKNVYKNNQEGLNFDEFHKIPKKLNVYDENINGVGIDLGTSKCCMAVNRQNGIETVALDKNGKKFLPSYVTFDENEESPKCGQISKNELKLKPKLTVFDSKRFMGKQLKDIKMDKTWQFEVKEVGDRTTIYFPGIGIQKAPEEVAGVLLENLKQKVEELFHGKELEDAAVAVPATFSNEQKISTLIATCLGKWKGTCFIPENVAAMFAYFIDKPVLDDTTVLLFDLAKNAVVKLSHACIYLGGALYKNKIRRKFIECGKAFGFESIKLLNYYEALYLNAMSQSGYQPKEKEIIWIFEGSFCIVWQKMAKAKFIRYIEDIDISIDVLKKFMDIISNFPDQYPRPSIILFNNDLVFDKEAITVAGFHFQTFYDNFNYDKIALIKAHVMSKSLEFIHWDAEAILDHLITLDTNERMHIALNPFNSLPITFSGKLEFNENVLQVHRKEALHHPFPNLFSIVEDESIYIPQCSFIFTVDTNQAFSIKYLHDKSEICAFITSMGVIEEQISLLNNNLSAEESNVNNETPDNLLKRINTLENERVRINVIRSSLSFKKTNRKTENELEEPLGALVDEEKKLEIIKNNILTHRLECFHEDIKTIYQEQIKWRIITSTQITEFNEIISARLNQINGELLPEAKKIEAVLFKVKTNFFQLEFERIKEKFRSLTSLLEKTSRLMIERKIFLNLLEEFRETIELTIDLSDRARSLPLCADETGDKLKNISDELTSLQDKARDQSNRISDQQRRAEMTVIDFDTSIQRLNDAARAHTNSFVSIEPEKEPSFEYDDEAVDIAKLIDQAEDIKKSLEKLSADDEAIEEPENYELLIKASREGRFGLEQILTKIDEAPDTQEAIQEYRNRVVDLIQSLLNLEDQLSQKLKQSAEIHDKYRIIIGKMKDAKEVAEQVLNKINPSTASLHDVQETIASILNEISELEQAKLSILFATELQAKCEQLRMLSEDVNKKYTTKYLDVSDWNNNIENYINITRPCFEKMCLHLLEQVREVLIQTFSNANYISAISIKFCWLVEDVECQ